MRDIFVYILAMLFALFLAFLFDEDKQQVVNHRVEVFAYVYLGAYVLLALICIVPVLIRKYRQSSNPKKASNLKIIAVTGFVLLGLYLAALWIL